MFLGEQPTEEKLKGFGNELVQGFRDSGFVYLKNHGLSELDVRLLL